MRLLRPANPVGLRRMKVDQVVQLLLAQVIAKSDAAARRGSQSQDLTWQGLFKGQILAARVVKLLASDRVILEIGGAQYEALGARQLQPGQTITVRVGEISPDLELEILTERAPEQTHLVLALRSLLSGTKSPVALMERLASLIKELRQTTPQHYLPEELVRQLSGRLAPIEVRPDLLTLPEELRNLPARMGLGFEATVAETLGGGESRIDSSALKPLLMQLLANLGGRQELLSPEQLESTFEKVWEDFAARWARSLTVHSRGVLERFGTQLIRSLGTALKAVVEQHSSDKRDIPLTQQPEVHQRTEAQLRTIFGGLRSELEPLLKSLARSDSERFSRDLEVLFREVERRFGEEVSRRSLTMELIKTASDLKERLNAHQLLNVAFSEKGSYLHFFFPVSIFGELADVQVKQFLSGDKKGRRKSLTAILLLDLESLGRLRIDALLQGRTLYVNIFVERRELVAWVEELGNDFAEQLSARGFALARLQCVAERTRVDDFNRLDAEFLSEQSGLIDVQV